MTYRTDAEEDRHRPKRRRRRLRLEEGETLPAEGAFEEVVCLQADPTVFAIAASARVSTTKEPRI